MSETTKEYSKKIVDTLKDAGFRLAEPDRIPHALYRDARNAAEYREIIMVGESSLRLYVNNMLGGSEEPEPVVEYTFSTENIDLMIGKENTASPSVMIKDKSTGLGFIL